MADILYKYKLNIPLKYNAYEINSPDKESEQVWKLQKPIEWEETYHVCAKLPFEGEDLFEKDEVVFYCLSSGVSPENEEKPDSYFLLQVGNVVAFCKEEAYGRILRDVHNVCRALSIMMNTHNVNIHSFQSQVAIAYDEIEWQEEEYEDYRNLAEEPDLHYVDENGVEHIVVKLHSRIRVDCFSFITLYGTLPPKEFMTYMRAGADAERDFVLEEYYLALGTENITSKFFHLFSIIEYVERKYSDLSGAVLLLETAELEQILQQLQNCVKISSKKTQRVLSRVRDSLSVMTDIGREKKLVNILHAMDIDKITDCATPFTVDESHIKELTALRNKQFHGGVSRHNSYKYISIELAVTRLFYICNGIIKYIVLDGCMDCDS